jgi:hypothetical protein
MKIIKKSGNPTSFEFPTMRNTASLIEGRELQQMLTEIRRKELLCLLLAWVHSFIDSFIHGSSALSWVLASFSIS